MRGKMGLKEGEMGVVTGREVIVRYLKRVRGGGGLSSWPQWASFVSNSSVITHSQLLRR